MKINYATLQVAVDYPNNEFKIETGNINQFLFTIWAHVKLSYPDHLLVHVLFDWPDNTEVDFKEYLKNNKSRLLLYTKEAPTSSHKSKGTKQYRETLIKILELYRPTNVNKSAYCPSFVEVSKPSSNLEEVNQIIKAKEIMKEFNNLLNK